MGRIGWRLMVRMKEHVPKCVRDYIKNCKGLYTNNIQLVRAAKKSAVAEHLLENDNCGKDFDWLKFDILSKCRNMWELKIMEAVTITSLLPNLNRQNEFDFVTTCGALFHLLYFLAYPSSLKSQI